MTDPVQHLLNLHANTQASFQDLLGQQRTTQEALQALAQQNHNMLTGMQAQDAQTQQYALRQAEILNQMHQASQDVQFLATQLSTQAQRPLMVQATTEANPDPKFPIWNRRSRSILEWIHEVEKGTPQTSDGTRHGHLRETRVTRTAWSSSRCI